LRLPIEWNVVIDLCKWKDELISCYQNIVQFFSSYTLDIYRFSYCIDTYRVGAHKMGWQLLIKINRNYLARIPGGKVRHSELYSVRHITVQHSGRKEEYDLLTNLTYQLEQDYRTVFVTRNWYDTIISGYLYHQSGRECWLSSGGKGGASGWLKNFNWEEYLEKERGRGRPYWPQLPAPNLCKYLELATPADGLRVYADFAIGFWLHSVSALAKARNSIPPAKLRTLFLCYDQFNENEKFPDAIKEAGHFLYPADDSTQWDGLKSDNHGGGGHSTTADKVFRMGLHDMLRIIDSEHFDGEIRAGNSKFGCKSEAESSLLTEAE